MKTKEQVLNSEFLNTQIAEQSQTGITFNEQKWKFGLLKQNRPINSKYVASFLAIISEGKYKTTESIKTVKAVDLEDKVELTDLNGNLILEKDKKDFLIVVDGQHRITAFARYNSIKSAEEKVTIPHVYILQEENIGTYLADLNLASHHWNSADKVCVSAIVTGNQILSKVTERIKEGFNASTAYLIYSQKKLNQATVNKILREEDVSSLPKEQEAIDRGDKFIVTCQCMNVNIRTLTKRYYIEGFNSHSKSVGDDKAFKALEKLTATDFKNIKSGDEFISVLVKAEKRS